MGILHDKVMLLSNIRVLLDEVCQCTCTGCLAALSLDGKTSQALPSLRAVDVHQPQICFSLEECFFCLIFWARSGSCLALAFSNSLRRASASIEARTEAVKIPSH